jgi:hypothetical protein
LTTFIVYEQHGGIDPAPALTAIANTPDTAKMAAKRSFRI